MVSFILGVLIVFCGLSLFGGKEVSASELKSNDVMVKSRQIIDFPINTLSQEVQNMYKENGWTITDTGAIREVLLSDGEVYVADDKYEIPNSGVVRVKRQISEGDIISTDEHSMKIADVEEIDGRLVAVFNVNMGDLFDHMDSEQFKISLRKGYGDKYYSGDWVHCNRFNGPASDDVHYPKSNPRSWVNFAGSDCDLALIRSTVCWGHSYCNQSGPAGGCSIKIGHSARYHRH